jgi:hypothetical protein
LSRGGDQLLPAGSGQLVKASFAVVVGRTPFGANPSARFEPLKGRIEGAVINEKGVFRLLLNCPGNPLPMLRSKCQRAQDEQIERPLQEGDSCSFFLSGRHATGVCRSRGNMSMKQPKTQQPNAGNRSAGGKDNGNPNDVREGLLTRIGHGGK